jgi:hypothetical protein
VIRKLLIPAVRAKALALAYAESAQSIDIFRGVPTLVAFCPAGSGQRTEPLAEPKPARTHPEFVGSLTDSKCASLFEHDYTLKL